MAIGWWMQSHIIAQLLAASLRSWALASFSPLKRFRLMNDLWRPKPPVGASPLGVLPALALAPVPVVPADDSAATSMTSLTLRWDVLEEVSE